MKVKALTRPTASYQSPGSSVPRQPRNLDPALHPFEKAREYTRALNATKLDRVFAKPFLGQLGRGHVDGCYTMARDGDSLSNFASGSGDGVVKVWDLGTREETRSFQAHESIVSGLEWTKDRKILSCSRDNKVHLWDPYNMAVGEKPLNSYLGSTSFTSLSHHRSMPTFAASSSVISVFDLERSSSLPLQTLHWPTSSETITSLSFNPVETSLLAAASSDRGITLFDLRTSSPLSKAILSLATNHISFNPQEALNFACANEDHNVYIFDMRNMKKALNILKGHVAPVMCVDFSPTGEELVTASWDKTLRLWDRGKGHSKDVYHTKRMQKVFSSKWTPDSKYVLSGSDDGNVRLWRANASQRSGIKSARQRLKLEYDSALRERYSHMPEIRRIARHRHVPKAVKKAGEIKAVELASRKRKRENERKHSKKGLVKRASEREKMVLQTEQ